MVQQELHPSDEGRQGNGDPGQPFADETSEGVSEALITQAGLPAPAAADRAAPAAHDRLAAVAREAVAWGRTLVSAGVYATLIVTFVAQVARVEGYSMAPTLDNEDRLIVNKLAYVIGDPQPGDIVMMDYPLDPDKRFVKRVIAAPGDTVAIEDGQVYVNGRRVADDFVASEYRSHDDHPPRVIPEGHYYVLGDHRNNSFDSRDWGPVPRNYITGKVQIRWWPIPDARVF